jgi:hypothetical protein
MKDFIERERKMRYVWLISILAVVLATAGLYGQDPEIPKPPEQPGQQEQEQPGEKPGGEQPGEKPTQEEPQEQPEPDDGKIVVYIDVVDYVDDKRYKWRMTEYLIAKTFELANPENKEKWKEEQRKRDNWAKLPEKEREKKIEKYYKDLRKKKGVGKLDLSHIKVIQWRPKPKDTEEGEKKEEGTGEEGGEQQGEEGSGDESGEQPEGQGEGDEKPAEGEEPAPKKKWVDPKETADFIITGEGRFKKGERAIYFGETVAWNSIGELHIRVIQRIGFKVVKEYKTKPMKRSHTLGQERVHQQCMQDLGQEVATDIVNLSIFRKK